MDDGVVDMGQPGDGAMNPWPHVLKCGVRAEVKCSLVHFGLEERSRLSLEELL